MRLHPPVNVEGVRCIMWEPEGGNVNPPGATHAYDTGAKNSGAQIHRFTPVTGTDQQPDGSWTARDKFTSIALASSRSSLSMERLVGFRNGLFNKEVSKRLVSRARYCHMHQTCAKYCACLCVKCR